MKPLALRIQHVSAVFGLVVSMLVSAGCERPPAGPPAPPSEPTTPAAKVAPDVPGGDDDAGMAIIVKDPHVSRQFEADAYRRDPRCPVGRLVGACKWSGPVIRLGGVPQPPPLDLAGPRGLKDPEPGELDYYANIKLREREYFVNNYLGTHPTGAVLMLRGIKSGRDDMVPRPNFLIVNGQFTPHMQFAPVRERVMFGTYDSYPTNVLMKSLSTGAVALDGKVAAFDRDTIKPLGGGGTHYTARPTMQQSKIVNEIDGYAITDRRHLWKRAYVFFLDNPYAVVSDNPTFSIENVPVGKWSLAVWHPEFKPVKSVYEVEIRLDETTELAVEFEPPAHMIPKKPDK